MIHLSDDTQLCNCKCKPCHTILENELKKYHERYTLGFFAQLTNIVISPPGQFFSNRTPGEKYGLVLKKKKNSRYTLSFLVCLLPCNLDLICCHVSCNGEFEHR